MYLQSVYRVLVLQRVVPNAQTRLRELARDFLKRLGGLSEQQHGHRDGRACIHKVKLNPWSRVLTFDDKSSWIHFRSPNNRNTRLSDMR